VVGDVNASVSGAVDVNSVPGSLTDQLDTLIEEVQNLASSAQELAYESTSFDLPKGTEKVLYVPEGVVLTDVIVSGNHASPDSDCVIYVFKVTDPVAGFGDPIFSMSFPLPPYNERKSNIRQLHSGILSNGMLQVKVANSGIFSPSDFCSGSILWSGYYQ
jgi:hypothetical protein